MHIFTFNFWYFSHCDILFKCEVQTLMLIYVLFNNFPSIFYPKIDFGSTNKTNHLSLHHDTEDAKFPISNNYILTYPYWYAIIFYYKSINLSKVTTYKIYCHRASSALLVYGKGTCLTVDACF